MQVGMMTKQQLIAKNYNEIYAHEMAHKMAGGKFAGDISIERNSDGIPVGGHVPILQMRHNKLKCKHLL